MRKSQLLKIDHKSLLRLVLIIRYVLRDLRETSYRMEPGNSKWMPVRHIIETVVLKYIYLYSDNLLMYYTSYFMDAS